jgi:hypothetical protein
MTSDEYLAEVLRILRQNFRSKDPSGGMTVAALAYLVKRSVQADQTNFGFAKFKDVLHELEARGELLTGKDSKGALSVWLADHAPTNAQQVASPSAESLTRLTRPMWFAFVSEIPSGYRYIHRATGEIKIGLSNALDKSEGWVEIVPLDTSVELQNAKEFAESRTIKDPAVQAALESRRWYAEFPKALAALNHPLAAEWNRSRSNRVIDRAKSWAHEHEIDSKFIFESWLPAPFRGIKHGRKPERSHLKSMLLTALGDLTTEELLNLQIPARQLVAALRPDLLTER